MAFPRSTRNRLLLGLAAVIGLAGLIIGFAMVDEGDPQQAGGPGSSGSGPGGVVAGSLPPAPGSAPPPDNGTSTTAGPPGPAAPAAPAASTSPAAAPAAPGAPGAASSLATAGDCTFYPQQALPAALMSWTVGAPVGDSQRVDLSDAPGGLETGRFLSSPPLSGQQPEFLWRETIVEGQTYTWRVVTTTGTASSTSPTHTFVGLPCLRSGGGEFP